MSPWIEIVPHVGAERAHPLRWAGARAGQGRVAAAPIGQVRSSAFSHDARPSGDTVETHAPRASGHERSVPSCLRLSRGEHCGERPVRTRAACSSGVLGCPVHTARTRSDCVGSSTSTLFSTEVRTRSLRALRRLAFPSEDVRGSECGSGIRHCQHILPPGHSDNRLRTIGSGPANSPRFGRVRSQHRLSEPRERPPRGGRRVHGLPPLGVQCDPFS